MANKNNSKPLRDFDDFMASYYRCFSIKNGELYCKDIIRKLAVKWTGSAWETCAYDERWDEYTDIKLDEVRKIAAFPPWDKFDEMLDEEAKSEAAEWEKRIQTTTRRVIGYTNTAFGSNHYMPVSAGDLSKDEYAAILKDFRAHDYFYSGEDYQDSTFDCTPVLDDYRYVDFSRRGFAALIAEANGDFSPMGYCAFTEAAFFEEDEYVFPEGGLHPDVERANSLIEVDEDTFRRLEEEDKSRTDTLVAVLVPEAETGYYWENDGVTLQYGNEYATGMVFAIGKFASREEYDLYQEWREQHCTPWREEYRGRVLLLVKPL